MASNHLFENQNELAIMTTLNVGSNSPLAQVSRKQCALVTDERFGGASTSESGDLARLLFLSLLFYLFIYFLNMCECKFFTWRVGFFFAVQNHNLFVEPLYF